MRERERERERETDRQTDRQADTHTYSASKEERKVVASFITMRNRLSYFTV